jgi:bifunctional DNA-binding transcriptional regulator/antitoxin component of YhaV-PrlF toxin-antitoxin module
MIQKSITMTSKGTITLPAKVRQALGVNNQGDKLTLTFHEKSGKIEISKGADFAAARTEVSTILKKKFPNGTPKLDLARIREQKHAHYSDQKGL